MFWLRSDPNVIRSEKVPSGPDTAIQTVPTGLSGVPPAGPATPVVALPYTEPVARRTPSAICSATGRLTAPKRSRSPPFTPSNERFTSFEYATTPPRK